ncbi:hypothetical protein [Schumannella sp. 10F1B-5-1]|uniref:hypothetical protein n=1 Tax=Schumannella sp. 10F1B-5-1 TaxID=2590780 RepID=UPI00113137E1|nr:hypothetical protein [Schumannella sp. 10F1B-5-1]TPW72366.1 hypothetical protein FJ658_08855 [Schumannella sp. 10F1B-5-1]
MARRDDVFPFKATHDPERERRERGPIKTGDVALSILLVIVGASGVGIAIALALVEAALTTGTPDAQDGSIHAAIALTVVGPALSWAIGSLIVLVRAVRRQRSWRVALISLIVGLVSGAAGALWWAAQAGVLN